MRWQDMPEGKEKYAAYLCSREWSVLKEAVRYRSAGICERCSANLMDHVHHLTYARKYNEDLGDLQACCKACHEFIHGKDNADPVHDRHILLPWCGTPVKTFYLAGKISGTHWRSSIVPGWSQENHSYQYGAAFLEYESDKKWAIVPNACTALGAGLHYAGPWWNDSDSCGHSSASMSSGPHGYGSQISGGTSASRSGEILAAVHSAIACSDMLFAWIDSGDCYGTIYEIGYAKAIGKPVVVGVSEEFCATAVSADMWLCMQSNYVVPDKSPLHSWNQFWNVVDRELRDDKPNAKAIAISHILKTKPLANAVAANLLERMVSLRRESQSSKEATDGTNAG